MADQDRSLRRPVLVGIGAGLLALVVLDAIGARAGVTAGLMPRLPGTAPWTASRAAGVTAYLALALDVIWGLLLTTRLGDRWIGRARGVATHQWLGAAVLATTLGHATMLLVDDWARFDALGVLVPGLSAWRPLAVALGVTAAWPAALVHVSFALRRRLGTRLWRRLHYLSFVALGLATVHGLAAGHDSGRWWMRVLYLTTTTVVLGLVAMRVARRPQVVTGR
jgi:predicted ferric reductase